jgi:hypothetical protein
MINEDRATSTTFKGTKARDKIRQPAELASCGPASSTPVA